MLLKDELKSVIIKSGWTMTNVVKELNHRHGTSNTIQNFSNKLRNETFKYTEVLEILDIIGYHVKWVKNDSN